MPDPPTKIALCIGINYDGAPGQLPGLRWAENDAQALADLLAGRGFQATPLIGAAATRRGILAALTQAAQAGADLLVLYLAGHGLHGSGTLDLGRVYFVPYDYDPTDSGLALELLDIAAAFESRFRAQNAFALLDCCYAGVVAGVQISTDWVGAGENWRQAITTDETGAPRGSARPAFLGSGPLPPTPTRGLVAACPGNVPSRELAELRHGIVTYYALEGWQGKAADPETGRITDTRLYAYIGDRLRERRLPPLARAPQIGDVILDQVTPPAVIPAPAPATGSPWPADCRIIDATTIAEAQAQAQFPGAVSLYARPGQQQFWHVVAGQDVRRELTDAILRAIAALGDSPGMRFQLITSVEGNGKSILMLRLAYELAARGEHVLTPASEGRAIDPMTLAAACKAAAAGVSLTPPRPRRRVYLLLDNAYRFQTLLLTTLATFPIDNLTILASARNSEVVLDAPVPALALPVATGAATGLPTFDPVELLGLNDAEAQDLVAKIRQYGTLQHPHPEAVMAWTADERIPLLLAVLALTNIGGIDEYVARRLVEVNNGRNPALEDHAQWEPFMRIYYQVAVCRAWGAYVPQALLPRLTGLTPLQVNALLCTGGAQGGQTGMAHEYLRGTCGGTWRSDHQLIAGAVVRQLAGDETPHARLVALLAKLADHPNPAGAQLIGAILHRIAVVPGLFLTRDPLWDQTPSPARPPDPPLPQSPLAVVVAAVADPVVTSRLATLHQVAAAPDLLADYAPAYLQVNRPADAVAVLSLALRDPQLAAREQALALRQRGLAYGRLRRFADAEVDFTRALALDAPHPDLFNARALTYAAQGRYEQALADFGRALALVPDDPGTLNNRGITYRHMHREDEALADFTHSLAMRHDDPATLNNRGITYSRMHRYEEALADFDHALAGRPNHPPTLINRGNVHHRLRHYREALADYSAALLQWPDSRVARNNRGATYRHLGRYTDAEIDYSAALAAHPDDPRLLYNRGTVYYYLRRYDDALRDLTAALARRPAQAAALTNRGAVYDNLGRFEEALADYTAALTRRPDHAETLYNRGCTYRHLRRLDLALADFTRALALHPDHPSALNNRGLVYSAQGRLDRALADFSRSLEVRPNHPTTLYNRAAVLTRLGRPADALPDLNAVLEQRPDRLAALNNRGVALALAGRYADALVDYSRALEIQPDDPETLRNRGLSYAHLGRWPEALADFSHSLTRRPGHADTLHNRAAAYYALGRWAEALADYTAALTARPDDPHALHDRAVTLLRLDRLDEALADLTRALALRPAHAPTLYDLAVTQARRGDLPAALTALRAALAADATLRARAAADSAFAAAQADPAWVGLIAG